jgi:pimeloyl-ACP methyl ester carboxylesterase
MHLLISTSMRKILLAQLSLLLLAGCVSTAQKDKDWSERGPYEVQSNDELSLYDAIQNRDVHLQVAWPSGNSASGPFPVVVFSHGAFCYSQQYARITDFWVSHGYIVISPDHLDSPNGPKMQPVDVPKMLVSRTRDMSFVLDSLTEIEARLPELKGRIDHERAAVAGHSFGGMIAMLKVGLKMESQVDGASVDLSDDRFTAAVVMSGVGEMKPMKPFPQVPTMSADAFSGLTKALIASGGTLDQGNVGTGEIYPWEWRMSPYRLAPPGDKYEVVVEDADHYLGGLICRDNKGGEDDPVAVEVVRSAQTAFLDAYVKHDQAALGWLRTTDFGAISGGRATLEYK